MDERKLTELFQSAVRDMPPASFTESDVATVAKRITVRRRTILAGGSLVVLAVIAVGFVIGGGNLGRDSGGGSSNSAAGLAVPGGPSFGRDGLAPHSVSGGAAQQQVPEGSTDFPTTTPLQGGGGVGGPGPGAGGTPSGCGPTDSELAVALANELASVGAPKAMPAGLACPAGARSAGYLVHDGTATGYVVAVVTNAGQPEPSDNAVGAARSSAPASNGRTVTVFSVPAAGSPAAPFSGAIFGMAEDLAGKV
ncbi:MAG TPA: hypothetical protein VH333_13375 [Pseudonocardiaceae bacterium]|jgi:hypothetical protein|nr:hypothetical protein [Pseudonocardiaceae bacterium]